MLLSGRMRRLLLGALAAVLVAPAAARAADPIMALADVPVGAKCTGLTVVRGTAISSFQVEVLDVIDRDRPDVATILVRVSGPLVDATGIGPGFSGSPILCPDAAGVQRNIGAISGGIGEYGGAVGLATPIERILSDPVLPPASASRSAVAGARSLAGPLTLAGARPSVAAMFARAARRAGHPLIASPASPRSVAHPPQPLVPGAAVAVGLTSGDVNVGSIGTVAYADAGNVWLFGHQLDGAGRRSLFLQDATIHTVVNNPVAAPDLSTYKLGSPGNDLGTVTSDTVNAVAGRLGALPASFPVRVTARDLDTGRVLGRSLRIADEGDVGNPAGPSILGLAGATAVAEAAVGVLGGAPARQSADMCVAITLRELRRPLRFCEHYAVTGNGPNALSGALAVDVAKAAEVIDEYPFGVLHPTNVEIGVRLRRGVRQAFLVDASGPSRARRGQRIALRLRLRRTGTGVRFTRTIRVRIPAGVSTGSHTIKLAGTDADEGVVPDDDSELTFLFEEDNTTDAPPQSVAEVRRRIEGLERFDGVTATLGGTEIEHYRDARLRISGDASVTVQIRSSRRKGRS
ncbi:MAG: hypothetical protein QOI73_2095 [Solirubrobacteraceae bacterium]|nr:hypothetical protein [Solirubrobacteraceae bacterium]